MEEQQMTNRKEQNIAKIIIILLFVVLFPMGIFSVYSKIVVPKESKTLDNPNHEFFYQGKLWFYTETGTLLGTYTCETTKCGYATGSYDDAKYLIDSYEPTDAELTLPLQSMVFLRDQNETENPTYFLYDIEKQMANKSLPFSSVKNYGIGIEDSLYIVENAEHKFGVIQVTNQMNSVIPFQYDFIGLPNNKNEEGKIISDTFIVQQGETWSLISRSNASLTTPMSGQIVSFQKENLITASDGVYHLVNYKGEDLLQQDFKKLSYIGKYLNCYDEEGFFYIMDIETQNVLGEKILIDEKDKVRTTMNGKRIEIYINENLQNAINVS